MLLNNTLREASHSTCKILESTVSKKANRYNNTGMICVRCRKYIHNATLNQITGDMFNSSQKSWNVLHKIFFSGLPSSLDSYALGKVPWTVNLEDVKSMALLATAHKVQVCSEDNEEC